MFFLPHVRESKTVLDSGFQAVDSGFQVLESVFVSGIWILDSKAQDSRFHKHKFHEFRNPDFLTWGDSLFNLYHYEI